MADKQEAPAAPAEAKVAVLNTGPGNMNTPFGVIPHSGSLEVPESYAKKIVGAYKHIVLAASVVPLAGKAEELAKENAGLKGKVAELEAKLAEGDRPALLEKIADLQGRLQEFVGADKKDLKALQEKHAEAVPETAKA